MILHTQYHGSRARGFRQEDFFICNPYILCKICDPRVGPFWPHVHNFNELGRILLGYATYTNFYQGSRPSGFTQEDYLCFPFISLCITCDPLDRAIFGPNKLGKRSSKCYLPL